MFLQGSVQKLASQLKMVQKQKTDLEAAWKECIKQNETTIAKLTSEKEGLEKELAQLKKKDEVRCGSSSFAIKVFSSFHQAPIFHYICVILYPLCYW